MAKKNDYNIEVFGRDGCSFCQAAKIFLIQEDVEYTYVDIEDMTPSEYEELMARTIKGIDEKLTIPIIFVDGEYIGGYEDLVEIFP